MLKQVECLERILIEDAKKRLGEQVRISGWVNRTRDIGSLKFVVLRDLSGDIQITVKPDNPVSQILTDLKLGREDVVEITGRVEASQIAHARVEVLPESLKLLNRSKQPLPLDVSGNTKAELDTRLNFRFLDFRTPRTSSIFKIQHVILSSFREFLTNKGFMEIQPPCIIASASEGGAELFKIPYFEKEAYLAQSPQLYKQMCAISFEKVFMVVPIWRAEKFNTPTHLNEVRQMDVEQAFADDEAVMKLLEEALVHIIKNVKEKNSKELQILGRNIEIPKTPLRRLTYTDAVELLTSRGEEFRWGDDFSKPQEKMIAEMVKDEAFFIKNWPSDQKAFYAMPYKDNPNIVHAFDLLYNGIEISSGTQRIHLPELLVERLKIKGLNPDDFSHYVECFSYGAPPHSGWSIGLERLTMTITGMNNIRECCMFPRDRDRLVP
ncbi:aspartate--tRNA(Asn) ligase [Candidatus Bathyarchaeota archaeon]|nr:aspartate--tRNA(Asn) ligase [Candidatus Bathyarchaeota archaeon]